MTVFQNVLVTLAADVSDSIFSSQVCVTGFFPKAQEIKKYLQVLLMLRVANRPCRTCNGSFPTDNTVGRCFCSAVTSLES